MNDSSAEPPAIGSAGQVAYLTNQYPSPSHSFIRREIVALEALGWRVHRFAHRDSHVTLVDPADLNELGKTRVLLDRPLPILLVDVLIWMIERPVDTLAAMVLAMRMAWHDDRRFIAHAAYFVMGCSLSRRLRALGCRHVHAHFGTNPAAVARLANRVCGLRYSVTFNGPHEFEPEEKLNLREKIKASSFIAAVTTAGRQQLTQKFASTRAARKRSTSWSAASSIRFQRTLRIRLTLVWMRARPTSKSHTWSVSSPSSGTIRQLYQSETGVWYPVR